MNSNSILSEKFPLIKKDESELTAYTEKYPWCSIAQVSLLHHYKKNNSLQFDQQATKTALFFNNTNWLNWQLHLLLKEAEIEESNTVIPEIYAAPEQMATIGHLNSNTNPSTNTPEEIIRTEPETYVAPEKHNENIEQSISYTHTNEELIQAERETPANPEMHNENLEQPISYTNISEEFMPAEPETYIEPEIQKENIEQPVSYINTNEELMPAEPETYAEPEMHNENMEQPVYTNTNEVLRPAESETYPEPEMHNENIEQPVYTNTNEKLMFAEPDTFAEPEIHNENTEQPVSYTNTNEEILTAQPETSAAYEMHNGNIGQPIFNPSPALDHKEEIITFEPLHTTDYFASQGIKLTDEPVSNDKLGSQLKSFTEWLKSMKKIHHKNLPAGDEQTDKNIQQIAEHSNIDAEVVTEAMADVLVKQDKNEKAIEVYEKLSLIYPSKSAYFAAKIESLSTDRQI